MPPGPGTRPRRAGAPPAPAAGPGAVTLAAAQLAIAVAGQLRQASQVTAAPADPDAARLLGWTHLGHGPGENRQVPRRGACEGASEGRVLDCPGRPCSRSGGRTQVGHQLLVTRCGSGSRLAGSRQRERHELRHTWRTAAA
jgi:hypothetical protein